MPETSQRPAGGPAGHESAAMLPVTDMCHKSTVGKLPEPSTLSKFGRVIALYHKVATPHYILTPLKKGPGRLFWSTFQPWSLVQVLPSTGRSLSPGRIVKLFPLF